MFYSWFLEALLSSDRMYDIVCMTFCWEITSNNSLHCSLSHYYILLSVAINSCTHSYNLSQTVKQSSSKICRCFVILSASSMMQVCNQEPAENLSILKSASVLWCRASGILRVWILIHETKSFYLHISSYAHIWSSVNTIVHFLLLFFYNNYIHTFPKLKVKMSPCNCGKEIHLLQNILKTCYFHNPQWVSLYPHLFMQYAIIEVLITWSRSTD